jgi:hypothetical protein
VRWDYASPSTAAAQEFVIKPVAEKKIKELPAGPLFWRVENFPRRAGANVRAQRH